jgi:hypothetical protein
VGDHPKNDLPEFDYKNIGYESREKTKSFYILNYLWELIINIWQFGNFYHEKSFVQIKIIFFQIKMRRKFISRRNHVLG